MARHAGPCSAAVALALCVAAPAAAQQTAGGTLLLKHAAATIPADARGARAGSAVALVETSPILVAIGEPAAKRGAGRVLLTQAELGEGLQPTPRHGLNGPGAGARAGSALASVASAPATGGFALLVGAPRTRVGGRGRPGAAFLLPASPLGGRLAVGGRRLVTIVGAADGDGLGQAVSSLDDIDGDGRSELLVGAPGTDVAGRSHAGTAWVIFSRGLATGDIVDLRGAPAGTLRIDGAQPGARTGAALAGTASFAGDGRPGAVLGAPGAGGGAGAAYVVSVSAGMARIDLAEPGPFLALHGATDEQAGTAVTVLRDANGDGREDIGVGAPGANVSGRGKAGAVQIVAGRADDGDVALLGAGPRISGAEPNDQAGATLAVADDGSGTPDLLIGAPGEDPLAHAAAGSVYVVLGRAIGHDVDLGLLGEGGVRMAGDTGSSRRPQRGFRGPALAAARGLALVGMPIAQPEDHGGAAYLLRAPGPPAIAQSSAECFTPAATMVLDDSKGLADADPRGLRSGALELLAAPSGNRERVIGAFEAAQRPAQVLLPFEPEREMALRVRGLADESVRAVSAAGDLGQALQVSQSLNPSARYAIVVSGPDATVAQAPPGGLGVDVVGVGVDAGSPQELALRRLAEAGGHYERVPAGAVQAQVAYFDAYRRCQHALPSSTKINGAESNPADVPALAIPVRSGGDFDAYAFSPKDTNWVDLDLTWTDPDAVDVETYKIEVEVEHLGTTTFDEDDLNRALGGETVCQNGIRLMGSAGDTFATFRLDFGGEDNTVDATISRHWGRYVHASGGVDPPHARASQAEADVYPQFFAPDPEQGDNEVHMAACG